MLQYIICQTFVCIVAKLNNTLLSASSALQERDKCEPALGSRPGPRTAKRIRGSRTTKDKRQKTKVDRSLSPASSFVRLLPYQEMIDFCRSEPERTTQPKILGQKTLVPFRIRRRRLSPGPATKKCDQDVRTSSTYDQDLREKENVEKAQRPFWMGPMQGIERKMRRK